MWGTQLLGDLLGINGRFIPTHVGNTLMAVGGMHTAPVHPHACGEHISWYTHKSVGAGSSPRMWGTLRKVISREVEGRFIPTHVGNT